MDKGRGYNRIANLCAVLLSVFLGGILLLDGFFYRVPHLAKKEFLLPGFLLLVLAGLFLWLLRDFGQCNDAIFFPDTDADRLLFLSDLCGA